MGTPRGTLKLTLRLGEGDRPSVVRCSCRAETGAVVIQSHFNASFLTSDCTSASCSDRAVSEADFGGLVISASHAASNKRSMFLGVVA